MNRTVWITRHGERLDYCDPNWIRTAQRKDDPPLAEKGLIQAKELATHLAQENMNHKIDHIVSSPFQRCIATAHVVATELDKSIKLEPGICEILWKFPPGLLPLEEAKELWPRVDVTYEPVWRPQNIENTDSDTVDRVDSVMESILNKLDGNILFVGHGASCLGIFYSLAKSYGYQGLCTLTKLNCNNGKWKVDFVGDSSHLSDQSNLRAY